MSSGKQANDRVWPECGAENPRHLRSCWICHRDLTGAQEFVVADLAVAPTYAPSEPFFAAASVIIALVVVIVGLGAAFMEPVLGVLFLVAVSPPLLATLIRIGVKKGRDQPVTWANSFLTFVISASVTAVALGLLGAALLTALFVYCLIEISKH